MCGYIPGRGVQRKRTMGRVPPGRSRGSTAAKGTFARSQSCKRRRGGRGSLGNWDCKKEREGEGGAISDLKIKGGDDRVWEIIPKLGGGGKEVSMGDEGQLLAG